MIPTILQATVITLPYEAVHFESDSTFLLPSDMDLLRKNVTWLKSHPEAVVILEGHCDKTGKSEYNMELGDKRAREVKSIMIQEGIMPNRVIMVVSFGEERPVDPGLNRSALQKNRRVEFVLR